jgi:glycosyltransferase involved in cell wall biosynthesis
VTTPTLERPAPEVSIILTSYNSEDYLSRTISSVLGQTFRDWELLVVDDGSTDHSREIISRYVESDPRVRPFFREANSGLPALARNDALGSARGKWVAILDSDDQWHREKLERQLEALSSHGAEFCSTRVIPFVEDSEVETRGQVPAGACHPERIDHRRLFLGNLIIASSVLVSRDVIVAERFNTSPRYRGVEDYDCWLRIHRDRIPHSIQLQQPLTYYRYAPGSVSASKLRMARRRLSLYYDHLEGARTRLLGTAFYSVTNVLVAVWRRRRDRRSRRVAVLST